jgi:hypothetical protein
MGLTSLAHTAMQTPYNFPFSVFMKQFYRPEGAVKL